jgi:hypothetical protein
MFKSMLLPPPWPPPPDGIKTTLFDFEMVAVMSLAASNRRSCTSPCQTQQLDSEIAFQNPKPQTPNPKPQILNPKRNNSIRQKSPIKTQKP